MSIMDHNMSRSARRSSSMVSSLPDDTISYDATSAYSSPTSATSHGRDFSTAIGLGISGCGLEPSLENVVGFSSPMSFHMTHAPPMPTHLTPLDDFYSLPVKVGDFPENSCYGIYTGVPESTSSALRYYDPQAMGVSPNYNPQIDTTSLHATFPGQVPGYWSSAACSGPTTPSDVIPIGASGATGGYWSPQCVPETCASMNAPVSPLSGGLPLIDSSYNHPGIAVTSSEELASNDNLEPALALAQPQHAELNEETPKKASRASRKATPSPKRKLSSSKGYACRICGYSFTRRSNCVEHEKKHDPSHRRSYPCEECNKTFGRMADLRRHIDNVSKFTH